MIKTLISRINNVESLMFIDRHKSGLTFERDSGEGVTLWSLTWLSRSKLPYVARIILPCVIYENVDVVFIEIYQMQVF